MRAAMALALGLLVGLCVACPGDPAQPTYKLENRRVHPLKIITRAAKGCARQLDLSDPDSYQGPVTQTLGAGHVVSMSWLWQQGHDPADEDPGGDGEPDAGGDVDPDAGTDSDGDAGSDADADAGNDGDAGSDAGSDARVRPYNPDEGCGAMWISLPEHDYEAVLAWDSAPYLDSEQDTWKYAVVIEGTKTNVGVHLPSGIRELEVPE